MPINEKKIYRRTLRNQQKRAVRKGWAADDPRIEGRAQRRAGQRTAFRQGIQSGDIKRPENRLARNMAFRDFIGQKYDPQRMERRYERRQQGKQQGGGGGQPGPFGGGGAQQGGGGGAGGAGGKGFNPETSNLQGPGGKGGGAPPKSPMVQNGGQWTGWQDGRYYGGIM